MQHSREHNAGTIVWGQLSLRTFYRREPSRTEKIPLLWEEILTTDELSEHLIRLWNKLINPAFYNFITLLHRNKRCLTQKISCILLLLLATTWPQFSFGSHELKKEKRKKIGALLLKGRNVLWTKLRTPSSEQRGKPLSLPLCYKNVDGVL